LKTRGVTSMQRLLGRPVDLEEVARSFVPEFAAIFGREVAFVPVAASDTASGGEEH
jgi:hypothetical protein